MEEELITTEQAMAYLEKEGLNVDQIVKEGFDLLKLKRKIELQKRWIPIKDGNYPKDHQQVFVCFENRDVAVVNYCDDVDSSWWGDYFIDRPDAKITHWMPYELPSV